MTIFDFFSLFIKEHPAVFYTCVGFLILMVVVIIAVVVWKRHTYVTIRCKIIEKDGNIRYTDVYIYKGSNIYKFHARGGGWEFLSDEDKRIIDRCRKRRTLHGGKIKPVIQLK